MLYNYTKFYRSLLLFIIMICACSVFIYMYTREMCIHWGPKKNVHTALPQMYVCAFGKEAENVQLLLPPPPLSTCPPSFLSKLFLYCHHRTPCILKCVCLLLTPKPQLRTYLVIWKCIQSFGGKNDNASKAAALTVCKGNRQSFIKMREKLLSYNLL